MARETHVRMLSDDPSLPTSFDRHESFPARSIPSRADTRPSPRTLQVYQRVAVRYSRAEVTMRERSHRLLCGEAGKPVVLLAGPEQVRRRTSIRRTHALRGKNLQLPHDTEYGT